jgi:hypothetical protein
LSGLDNIEAGSINDLNIENNTSLSTCDVKSICDYLTGEYGSAEIYENAPGCNSAEEVKENCLISVEENYNEFEISISPNPADDYAVLSLTLSKTQPVKYGLYNLTGICLKSQEFENQQPGRKEYILDLTDLPAGIYFYRLQVGTQTLTGKIIRKK